MGVPGNGNNPNAHRALGQALKCHSTGRRLVRHSARELAQASRGRYETQAEANYDTTIGQLGTPTRCKRGVGRPSEHPRRVPETLHDYPQLTGQKTLPARRARKTRNLVRWSSTPDWPIGAVGTTPTPKTARKWRETELKRPQRGLLAQCTAGGPRPQPGVVRQGRGRSAPPRSHTDLGALRHRVSPFLRMPHLHSREVRKVAGRSCRAASVGASPAAKGGGVAGRRHGAGDPPLAGKPPAQECAQKREKEGRERKRRAGREGEATAAHGGEGRSGRRRRGRRVPTSAVGPAGITNGAELSPAATAASCYTPRTTSSVRGSGRRRRCDEGKKAAALLGLA
ncbi:hypothetical protein Taro_014295 [Colocasia esculenta]|uniref:Uncharacterized protein n=1 Tax=Colocasia esculenta TaxID=4460 RepID=A0A843UEH6_COLES|nr:hypothetical protein [Colocasia esculenta]